MSESKPKGQHWPDESIWTRKLRRFRGRLGDDPAIEHFLATLHTRSKTNPSGLATAALLLTENGKPAGRPRFSNSGPATPTPGQVPGADLVVGSKATWDPGQFRGKIAEVVDDHIERAQQTPDSEWHVLYTRTRVDLDADWCLVYARGSEHARRKLPLPDASPWGDRDGVEHVGSWREFARDVRGGAAWTADADAISLDNEARTRPPEDACEVFHDASR